MSAKRRIVIGIVIEDGATIDDLNTLNDALGPVKALTFVRSCYIGEAEYSPALAKVPHGVAIRETIKVRRRPRTGTR